jgi:hypothetical protein
VALIRINLIQAYILNKISENKTKLDTINLRVSRIEKVPSKKIIMDGIKYYVNNNNSNNNNNNNNNNYYYYYYYYYYYFRFSDGEENM